MNQCILVQSMFQLQVCPTISFKIPVISFESVSIPSALHQNFDSAAGLLSWVDILIVDKMTVLTILL